jgi:hypothetical protein
MEDQMAEPIRDDEMLSLAQAQQIFGVKRPTLYRYIRQGRLKTYRRGMDRQAYVRRGDLESLRQFRPRQPATGFNLAALERAEAFRRRVFGDRALTPPTAEIIEESRLMRPEDG